MAIHKAKQFSVDSEGAYLVDLYDAAGGPILFPRATIDGKRRGGAHVCFPYFGPDAAGVMPQHGFGRDVEWKVELLDLVEGSREIRCTYEENEHELFAGLSASLLYRLNVEGASFSAAITVTNAGEKPLPVTPGFHPYFTVDPSDVRLNGKQIDLADYEPFKEFPNTSSMTVESGKRAIAVSSPHLQHTVAWTDTRGDYLCIEPTLSGNGFDSGIPVSDSMLMPGETVSYAYTISWG